jgi:hypothetical protein
MKLLINILLFAFLSIILSNLFRDREFSENCRKKFRKVPRKKWKKELIKKLMKPLINNSIKLKNRWKRKKKVTQAPEKAVPTGMKETKSGNSVCKIY